MHTESPVNNRVVGDNPKESFLEDFGRELNQAGYAGTTEREHIRAAQHFIYWTDRKGIAVAGLMELIA